MKYGTTKLFTAGLWALTSGLCGTLALNITPAFSDVPQNCEEQPTAGHRPACPIAAEFVFLPVTEPANPKKIPTKIHILGGGFSSMPGGTQVSGRKDSWGFSISAEIPADQLFTDLQWIEWTKNYSLRFIHFNHGHPQGNEQAHEDGLAFAVLRNMEFFNGRLILSIGGAPAIWNNTTDGGNHDHGVGIQLIGGLQVKPFESIPAGVEVQYSKAYYPGGMSDVDSILFGPYFELDGQSSAGQDGKGTLSIATMIGKGVTNGDGGTNYEFKISRDNLSGPFGLVFAVLDQEGKSNFPGYVALFLGGNVQEAIFNGHATLGLEGDLALRTSDGNGHSNAVPGIRIEAYIDVPLFKYNNAVLAARLAGAREMSFGDNEHDEDQIKAGLVLKTKPNGDFW